MKKLLVILLILVTCMTVVTGCGPSPKPSPEVVTFISDNDGNVFSNSTATFDGTEMGVGDRNDNVGLQALMSFTISLPAGAKIKTATLRLYNSDFPGASFPSNILVEHLHVDFGEIDPTDLAGDPGSLTSCGEFSSLNISGWNELAVTSSVKEDQTAERGKSQFRLYRIPLTDNDNQWDINGFYTSEVVAEPSRKPELVITYTK